MNVTVCSFVFPRHSKWESSGKMVALSLKICVRHCNVVKTMQFEPSTAVYDACRVIRERVPEAQTGQGRPLVIYWLLEMCLYVFPLIAKETEALNGTQVCMFQMKCLLILDITCLLCEICNDNDHSCQRAILIVMTLPYISIALCLQVTFCYKAP